MGHSARPTLGLNFIIIGAESGNRKDKIVPAREWIRDAVDQAKQAGVAVFVKGNISETLYPKFAGIQEFPFEPQRHRGTEKGAW